MNNREIADNFFETYLSILGISDEKKIYKVWHHGGESYSSLEPVTLSDYLAEEVDLANMQSIVLGTLLMCTGGAWGFVVEMLENYCVEEAKRRGNDLADLETDFIKHAINKQIDQQGLIFDNTSIGNGKDLGLYLIKNLVNFDDRKILETAEEEINGCFNAIKAHKNDPICEKDAPLKNKLDSSYTYLESIIAMLPTEREAFSEQQKKELNSAAEQFVRDYVTHSDYFHGLIDELVRGVEDRLNEASGQYKVWYEDGQPAYYKQYFGNDGTGMTGEEHQRHGKDNGGLMDSFRQIYSAGQWALKWGTQTWADDILKEVKIDRKDWVGTDLECKMDIWNSYIGRVIGEYVDRALRSDTYWGKSENKYTKAYFEEAERRIAVFAKAAIDKGVAAKSKLDPRLELLDDFAGFNKLGEMRSNAENILASVWGGIKGDQSGQLFDFLSENQPAERVDLAEAIDCILKNSTYSVHRDIADNNTPGASGRHFDLDEAHVYLQIVQWANSNSFDQSWAHRAICDPSGDPFAGEDDVLDDDAFLREITFKERFVLDEEELVGTVYYSPGLARYYIVFNEFKGICKEVFDSINGDKEPERFTKRYLNTTYQEYRKILDKYGLSSSQVTLLGYGEGGAVASALSAALYCGAFTEDTAEGGYGVYDAALAYYGWSLNEDGEVINNYAAEAVDTITFNAPSVGWVFQKPEIEESPGKNSVYEYRFDYPKYGISYSTDMIKNVPVTNFGMLQDKTFSDNKAQFGIGKTEMLFHNDGKIQKYIEKNGYEPDWHNLDTIELALHAPGKEEKDKVDDGGDDSGSKGPKPTRPPQVFRDPLIIDLNRDGKVSTTAGKRYFDLDANGIAERVSWAGDEDGFLVLDRDGDGRITSGRELFGDSTVMSNGKIALSGFEALADLDSNGDGVIDANDEVFSQLRIWADKDGDGIFGDGEFYTLDEIGIESISLQNVRQFTTDENGNQIVRTGKITWKDGDSGLISEFLLDRSTRQNDYPDVDVSEEIATLPDLPGRGALYPLQQAMMRDESGKLKTLVEKFAAEEDSVVRRALLEQIMMRWGEVSDPQPNPQEVYGKDWLVFLDKYHGGIFVGEPTSEGWRVLEANYEAVSLYVYSQLLQQTHFDEALSLVDFDVDEEGDICLCIGRALESIAKGYADNPEQTKRSLSEFFLALKDTRAFDYLKEAEIKANEKMLSTYGAELVNVCRAAYMAMQLPIGEFMLPITGDKPNGSQALDGGDYNDVVVGGDAEDILNGGFGVDILMGGRGDDVMIGGRENDIFVWNLGDGNDTILNSTSGDRFFNDLTFIPNEVDVLRIGEGVHPDNVTIERHGNTIRLVIGESGEIITLATDLSLRPGGDPMNPELQLAQVEFADGTVWSREYMLSRLVHFSGTEEGETLEASVGDDVLDGGAGDDILRGGRGSDTYIWRPGDGNDTIRDERSGAKDINVLKLEGVRPEDMELIREGDNLVLALKESGERITLEKWYGQVIEDRYRLHRIEFGSGEVWTTDDIDLLEVESEDILGTDSDDILDGTGGSEFLIGKKGSDILRGGAGSDTYVWNLGDGDDTILDRVRNSDENVLRFGEGIDAEMLEFRRNGDDIFITVKETGETITVSQWDSVENHKLARIEFADGSQMTAAEIDVALGDYVQGTDEKDVLRGSWRHRTLDGRKGDDFLYGGQGGCTYLWNVGDGNDTIQNEKLIYNERERVGESYLQFGEDVKPEDLSMRCLNNDLVVTHRTSGEKIVVEGWYSKFFGSLTAFLFSDGTVWEQEVIELLREKEIYGTDGDDELAGFNSDDILIGGKGDDALQGGRGSDTYIWERGDGNDKIYDLDVDGNTPVVNTLHFRGDILSGDIRVSRDEDALLITIADKGGENGGTIRLPFWFANGLQRGLSKVVFGDGESWTVEELEASLDKTIRGGDDDDTLNGCAWDDTFIGGRGNDLMRGKRGEDTYIWNLGDGNDRIEDWADIATNSTGEAVITGNILKLGAGITPETVHLREDGNALLVTMLASGETITLVGWNSFKMEFANGVVWDAQTMLRNIDRWIIGTSEADRLEGTTGDDFIAGLKGDDLLFGGSGNDTYVWNLGDGNDRISDYHGMSLLQFGTDVNPEDLHVARDGNHLILTVGEGGESITVDDWFRNKLCTIKFSDGTSWDAVDIGMRVNREYIGTDGNDSFSGTEMDEIYIGGKGNDWFSGNGGEDLYIWNLGDGHDYIDNLAYLSSNGNSRRGILRFGEGVDPNNITIRNNGSDLTFVVGETGETVTVWKWRNHKDYTVARIEFADGTVWKAEEIDVDTIVGTDGSDILSGISRNETIIGGKGNDTLSGGAGSDTYVWNLGDGDDTIIDLASNKEVNILKFGEGVDPANITSNNNGADFMLIVGETGETITIKNCRSDSRYLLHRIEFADGTVWGPGDLDLGIITGTDDGETLTGSNRNETLTGGKGDDILLGHAGDDTYVWNPGDGNDTIYDDTGANTMVFGEGVDPDNLRFLRYGDDIVFEVPETGERIRVQAWYAGRRHQFYQMKFADGTVWSRDEIAERIGIFGTDEADHLTGTDADDRFFGFAGDDTLEGGAGDDVYEWNLHDGNDTIRDTEGVTRVKFGKDVSPNDIRVGRDDTGTILFSLKTGEKIRLEGPLFPDEVLFEDGTVWTRLMMQRMNLTIFGTESDDTIFNSTPPSGETVYAGGKGDDAIYGAKYNDTFVWNLGDGDDTIQAYNYETYGNVDVLRFGEGVLPGEVLVARSGDDGRNLSFIVEKTGERITFASWLSSTSSRLSEVRFADGTVWTQAEIDAMQYTYKGMDDDDVLAGFEDDDLVIGGKGHDRLYGNAGDDILRGGEGNDKLYGNAGDDTLVGGKEIDLLEGGEGYDVYEWNLGDGDDILKDSDNSGELRFGDGIDPANVQVSLQGSEVVLKIGESGEKIQLKSYLSEIVFADGTTWSWEDVLSFIGPSVIRGTNGDDTLEGTILDDTIAGGRGNDVLRGGDGNDRYLWARGDGSDIIEDASGVSTLDFGDGIVPEEITTSFEGSSLVLTLSSGECITVKGWLDDVANRLTEIRFADGTIWTPDDIREMTPPAVIEGTGEADDPLNGTDMHDIITGKAGDDKIFGGEGDDTYVWNLGDGNDRIADVQGKNVLRLGAGVSRESLRIVHGSVAGGSIPFGGRVMGADMSADGSIHLIVGETGERVAIESWSELCNNGSFEIHFEDGSILTIDDMKAMVEPLQGTDASETITGYDEDRNDVIDGGKGDDTLAGKGGDDTLFGGEDHDMVMGNDGDDVLIGGHGDDTLSGGPGDDTYIWNLGDGNDFIDSSVRWYETIGFDILQFGEGVGISDLSFGLNNGDLQIFVKEGDPENEALLTVRYWLNPQEGQAYSLQGLRFSDGTVLTAEQIDEKIDRTLVRGTRRNDYLNGTENDETFIGGAGNDSMTDYNASDDTYFGGAGDDDMYDSAGNDTYVGGLGDDTMNDSAGDDTYIWNIGDGNDRISDGKGNDIIQFGDGINPEDIKACREGDDLVLVAEGAGDGSITLEYWFSDSSWVEHLGQIHFRDGTVWTYVDTQELVLIQGGTSEGDDLVWGTSGNDDLDGLGGNDVIRGNDGNDMIWGGRGNDNLYGGGGDDTYVWTVGDGNDMIEDAQGENVLRIEGGVDPGDIRIENNDTDLILVVGGERITVKNWLTAPENQLKGIRIGDSAIWDSEYINTVLSQVIGTEGNDILEGQENNRNDTMIGRGGDDVLKGGGGDDTYIWNIGDGNDTIEDFAGKNVLQFGEGITRESVQVERDRDNLYFVVGDERIRIENWWAKHFITGTRIFPLDSVRFSDGTAWNRYELEDMIARIAGTDGVDSLQGYENTSDTFIGLAGDDTIYGGGGGLDTILWNVGDGNDTILDASARDTLSLGAGIARNSVRFERDEEHLYIVIGSERIKVEGWYQKGTRLGKIVFADGTKLTSGDIDDIVANVKGSVGNDILHGYNNGNEVIEGCAGDDELYGGGGSDTYVWNIGDGNDFISDVAGSDVLRFGSNVGRNMVRLERDNEHLYVAIGDERITLENWFVEGNKSTVRHFVFADGSAWDRNKLYEMACRVQGTDSKDTLSGYDTNDTLVGGKGDDILQGGGGDDTYVWNIGDGDDRIADSRGKNVLILGDDIYSSFVRVRRDGDHLHFDIDGELITVENWFSDPVNSQLQEVRFADGVVWSRSDVQVQLGITEELDKGRIVRGTAGDDYLEGSTTVDRIYGGGGNDRIRGGKGDDKLYGEGGNDIYEWSVGHGSDRILDSQGKNILEFGAGIAPGDFEITRDNQHLYITHKESGERVAIESWYAGASNKLSQIRFADGTVWSAAYIDSLFVPMEGTEGNDSVLGYDSDDVILGLGGDDIISGRGGNDVLIGGAGSDKLYGGAGDDVYVWEPGHGSDRIGDGEGVNTLRFGEGVFVDGVRVTRDANNLYFHVNRGETICVEGWFRNEKNRLGSVEFADGTRWNIEDVENLLAGIGGGSPTEDDDTLIGSEQDDVIDGLAGNDLIYGGNGNDLLVGNKGRDILRGEAGDDTYFWNLGDGNDIVVDSQGSNRVEFGPGIDWSMVEVEPYGMDLMLRIGQEYVRIADWFKGEANQLAEVVFADGTVWSREQLNESCNVINGTGEADTLQGTEKNDLILGQDGDDRLFGGIGGDSLFGGKGADYLDGGKGDDSYIWNPGDGNDTIDDYSGRNVLQIGEGIDPKEVEIQCADNDLILVMRQTGERLRVNKWFVNADYQMAEVRFADGTAWTAADIDRMPSVYRGTEGRDSIYASGRADEIYGSGGDDYIYGGAGHDTITGGTGNDSMQGGIGDDTYIWNLGDGNDTINDNSGVNVLKLGEGIVPSDIALERSGSQNGNMVFVVKGTGERITVENWLTDNRYQLARIEFADGTVWTRLDVTNMSPRAEGTEGNDVLYGTLLNDTLMGLGGTDKLYGYAGRDTLIGGAGNDRLEGGVGDDIYIWSTGDGSDDILDASGANVLQFGEGLSPDDFELTREDWVGSRLEENLILVVKATGEHIRIWNWYRDEKSQFAEIRFGDGTVWTKEDVSAMSPLFKGTSGQDALSGSGGNDRIEGYEGDDKLYGNAGNDTLIGGTGSDTIDGGVGDDTYIWNLGDGNDTLRDNMGKNVLAIGDGVDPSGIGISLAGPDEMDLRITIGETGEFLTIQNWRSSRNAQFSEIRFGDGTVWTLDELKERFPFIDDRGADDVLYGTEGDDTLKGFGGKDKLYGLGGDDTLMGGDDDDELRGGEGNDRLIGGAGIDIMDGAEGDDTYVWNPGDGSESIGDSHGSNALEIGEGVDPAKVVVSRNIRDLYLQITETGEQLTIKDWYYDNDNQLAEIRFADGTIWRANDVNMMSPVLMAPEEGGIVTGFNTNDTLIGGAGRDALYGNAGNDTLEGRRGDDYFDGGVGDDTYVWNLGDGNDTISDAHNSNVLEIGAGVDPEKVTIGRNGDGRDLYLQINETGEILTIRNWYSNTGNQLAKIRFADGTVWTTDDVSAMNPTQMAPEEGGTIAGFGTDDIILGGSGDDRLYGNAGNDILEGKGGNDYLDGGYGDDTYIWNLGDGNDTIHDYYGRNVLKIGGAVFASDVTVALTGENNQDLLITIGTSGEKIVVQDWGVSRNAQLAEILFEDGTIWSREDINAMLPALNDGDTDDIVEGMAGTDVLHGYGGNDKLYGRDGDDSLFGDGGNDELYGGAGHDALAGGTGIDRLEGGAGDDIYIWNPGDGNDVIADGEGNNILRFGDGVQADDVRITRDENSLWFQIGATGENIRIDGWYENTGNQLSEVRFADGTVWTRDDVNAMNPVISGEGEDTTLTGFDTDDILSGSSGDETLSGGAGDDTLIGDAGDDRLEGGTGNDTYVWNLGDGNDTIADGEGDNVLQFGEGVNSEAVEVSREGDDLYVRIGDDGERIRIEDWFTEEGNQLSEIRFGDGTTWTREDVNAMFEEAPVDPIDQATNGDDVLTGTTGNDTLDGLAGNDTIYGGEGDDAIIGGLGNDNLQGGAGNDTYAWNLGDGSDVITDNRDSNKLQLGDGITQNMVNVGFDGRDLILTIGTGGEKIRIAGWLDDAANRLAAVEFADGSTWDTNAINAKIALISGTDGDDTVNGTSGNDILSGGAGNDTLNGDVGNDVLIGGAGNDNLEGGKGNDTYIWNPGDGNDTIYDYLYSGNGVYNNSILKIGEGVDPANVQITRSDNNLIFLMGNGEAITVKEWYYNYLHQISEVQFADGTIWTSAQINAMMPILMGTDGDDTISGYSTDDTLSGGVGSDTLKGNDGNDTLIGGAGNDNLEGGKGNDTYIWNPGDGNDTIYDYLYSGNGVYNNSILKIGEGVDPANVQITRSDNNLIFLMGNGEAITVKEWYYNYLHQISEVQFADGTIWTSAQINAMMPILMGTDGDDTISGYSTDDTLSGGVGSDTLKGNDGNDTLIGGAGNDNLEGGKGNDTYIWNPGDGNDTINDYRINTYETTILRIGEGITPADVQVTRSGNDLILLMGNEERITVKEWYNSNTSRYQLTSIAFADGTIWGTSDINAKPLVLAGTNGDDTINGTPGNDTIIGCRGNDTINGEAGNDTYIWNLGDGSDTIQDNQGNNKLQLGGDITQSMVNVGFDGRDLILTIGNDGGKIRIAGWLDDAANRLALIEFADGSTWSASDINTKISLVSGTDGSDTLNGTSGNEILSGGASDDTLNSGAGNDTLAGGVGNDRLYGGDGHDTLIGGKGDDYLEAGRGWDTYIWNKGDGNDTINDYMINKDSWGYAGVLKLGEGVSAGDVELSRSGDNLIMIVGEDKERITLQGWYAGSSYQLGQVEFADGSTWSQADINGMSLSPVFRGTDGEDAINGYNTNDVIYGGEGNDRLNGGDGHDTLVGGKGDDNLEGGRGWDTYVWNKGDGNDTINDYMINKDSWGYAGVLKLGEGVSAGDVELSRSGDNLIMIVGEDKERITLQGWYAGSSYQLGQIEFADGSTWSRADINGMSTVLRGTDGEDVINGYNTNDVIYGGEGNDRLNGGDGHDTLAGGKGDDNLEGGRGWDTYVWNKGDGNDTINDYMINKDSWGYAGVLKLGEGINAGDIELSRSGDNLIMIIGEDKECITLQGWYAGSSYQLGQIEFADGSTWSQADINAMSLSPVLRGTDGDDVINGYITNDIIYGGNGNDRLNGGDEHDTLIGGRGDDYLEGGRGWDTYIWDKGDGNDTINDYMASKDAWGYAGVLKLGGGVNALNARLERSGNDMVFIYGETGERVTIQSWYAGTNYQLGQAQFADGTVWTRSDIDAIAAGTKQPFSTASVVESQSEEGEMGPLSAPMSGNGENAPMFSLLGDPSAGVQTSYRYGEEIDSLSSLAATPTDWASDPSLASIMNEPELVTAGDFTASQLDVDIAVASLQFGAETPEQVCDLVGSAASASGSYTVSTSAESSVADHFSEEQRKSA